MLQLNALWPGPRMSLAKPQNSQVQQGETGAWGTGNSLINHTMITLSPVTYCRLSVSFLMRMRYWVILVKRCLHLCRMNRGQ